ncbi:hypothetical protein BV378_14075 [Nostoc sp. RF31YmG]|nr:hypothetical protein BV378_14075 [Nostoc sp. RF31YmG]
MSADVSLYQRSHAAMEAHAVAIREGATAWDRKQPQLFAFWQDIARACVAEFEECDAAIRAGVEAYLGFSDLQTGNADLYPLEA